MRFLWSVAGLDSVLLPGVDSNARLVGWIAVLLCAGVLAYGAGWVLAQKRRYGLAWRASLRAMGWVGLAASVGLMVLLFVSETMPGAGVPWADKARVVELIIPLMMAVHAGLIFSPDDEPALETILVCPRPVIWLLLERLAVIGLAQTGVALIGIALSLYYVPDQDIAVMVVRWIPAAFLLTGVAVYTTIRSRVAAFGATVVGLVWFMFAFFGHTLLPGGTTFWPLNYLLPFIWIFNPYLEPISLTMGDYWLNRLCVLLVGANLILAALYLMRNEESLLLGSRRKGA